MKVSDFQRKFLLLLSVHSDYASDGEIRYPDWAKLKKGIYALLGEAGDEARCVHPKPLYDGIICITCGRKPSRDNTLPPPTEAA